MNLPGLFVRVMPFCECSPCTADGIRRLARIALDVNPPDLVEYLDALELLILQVLHIKPESVGRDMCNNVIPIAIERTGAGVRVRWNVRTTESCDACRGDGELKVYGRNDRAYYVECPECGGLGHDEEDDEHIYTDIDGRELLAA